MSPIKSVILTGATGSLGKVILAHLKSTPGINLGILRRAGSSATFSSSLRVVDADFTSLESLTTALGGQDAVVSAVGTAGLLSQMVLADAADAAGVKLFVPSNFGADMSNPLTRALPIFRNKVVVEDHLIAKVKGNPGGLAYSFIYSGAFLDWGLERGSVLGISNDAQALVFDGGDLRFSSSTLDTIARAVVGVLRHPDESANRVVRVQDVAITQNRLLELSKQVAPEKEWKAQHVRLDQVTARSDERLKQGLHDMETFLPYLYRAMLDPRYGGHFGTVDNDWLGVKEKGEDVVVETLQRLLK